MLNHLFEKEQQFLLEKQTYEDVFAAFIKAVHDVRVIVDNSNGKLTFGTDDSLFNDPTGFVKGIIGRYKKHYGRVDRVTFALLRYRLYAVVEVFNEFTAIIKTNTSDQETRNLWFQCMDRWKILINQYYRHLIDLGETSQTIKKYTGVAYTKRSDGWYIVPSHLSEFLDRINHYMTMLYIPKIDGFNWAGKTAKQLIYTLNQFEVEYNDANKGFIPEDEITDKMTLIHEFGDGFGWYDLNTPVSDDEARAMGHCCTDPRTSGDGTVYSLREKSIRKNKTFYRPSVTMMVKDKLAYEVKGRGNDKPVEEYHPYILWLIQNNIITGFVGGGYMPQNNFRISDIRDKNLVKKLVDKNPGLVSMEEVDQFYKKGSPERMKWAAHYLTEKEKILIPINIDGKVFYKFDDVKYKDIASMLYELGDEEIEQVLKEYNGDGDYRFEGSYEYVKDHSYEKWLDDSYLNELKLYMYDNYLNFLEEDGHLEEKGWHDWDIEDVLEVLFEYEEADGGGELIDAAKLANAEGEEIGAESERWNAFKRIVDHIFVGEIPRIEICGVEMDFIGAVIINPNDPKDGRIDKETKNGDIQWTLDSGPVYLGVKEEDLQHLADDVFIDNYQYYGEIQTGDGQITLDQPRYGWSGWSEEAAKERFGMEVYDTIIHPYKHENKNNVDVDEIIAKYG